MTIAFGHPTGDDSPVRPGATVDPVQGIPLSEAAFTSISRIAYREAGLSIAPGKSAMVRTRLARRLRALRLASYDDYCDLVQSAEGAGELGLMISALTTNVSHFFREEHHFDILRDTVLPVMIEKARRGGRVRLWSAGCSNGQEPYTLAMTLLESGATGNMDIKILATDIDTTVVSHARAGFYPDRMLSGLPDRLRQKYFAADQADNETGFRAEASLKALVSFRELNLLRPWPMQASFDVIFCRNVVIYFDAETQDTLWKRFAAAMAPGSWLFLGHSERVSEGSLDLFEKRGVTAYQRTNAPAPRAGNTTGPTRQAG